MFSNYARLLGILLSLALIAALPAQLSNATIKGTVTDVSGAVLYGSDGTGDKDRQFLTNTDTLCEKNHWKHRL